MASVALRFESRSILRFSAWDTLFVALAGVHGAVLFLFPGAPAIAAGLWWNANTISHNFIHRPFFRPRMLNRLFSAYLSVLLGFPQTLWRDRHLAHHAGASAKLRISLPLLMETLLVGALWMMLAALRPRFFLVAYLPGWLLGLALCAMQGRYEHARGTVSHYGRIYNWLCFNDGYHAEHHGHPGIHWTQLPEHVERSAATSRWPPLLRWLDDQPNRALEILERLVLGSRVLQRFVIGTHSRACKALLLELLTNARKTECGAKAFLKPLAVRAAPFALPRFDCVTIGRVIIVGGALFPRTALILRGLLPEAHIAIMDASAANLETARANLPGSDIEWIHRRFDAADPCDCDLLVIPLSFQGDRARLYRDPPVPAVLVHDWIWRKRGSSRIVSIALLKRVNLIRACER